MTTVIFEYNGKSKEMPISDLKSASDIAQAYKELGLNPQNPKNKRLGYTLPNGKTHSFLSTKNHKYAVCCTHEDTKLGFGYTDNYEVAEDIAWTWSNKWYLTDKEFVVVDIKELD